MRKPIVNKIIVIIFFTLMLNGCVAFVGALIPPKISFTQLQLNENTWRITGTGNHKISREKLKMSLYARAAYLTKKHNYSYFLIVQSQLNNNPLTYTTPGHTSTTGAYSANVSPIRGTMNFNPGGTFSSRTTLNPGKTYNWNNYKVIIVIRMLKTNKNNPNAINARMILQSLNSQRETS